MAPALAASLHRHLDAIGDLVHDAPGQLGVAHGDFGHSQVLFDGPTTSLVDFDAVCRAEPALDLGSFTADLAVAVRRAPDAARAAHDGEDLGDAFLREYVRLSGTPRPRRPARPRRRLPDGGAGPPRRPELVPTEATATPPRPGAPRRTAAYPDRRAVTPRGGTSKSIDTPGHGSYERALTVASFEASPACRGPHGVHMTGTDRRILRNGALPAITIVRCSRFSDRRGGAAWR